jgi:hypothetical protein
MPEQRPQPSFEEFQEQLKEREQAIQDQLDRIYTLVEEGKAAAFIQIEFKRAVERITEKYQILNALLEAQRAELETKDFDDRAQALKDQYKEDVVLLAAAIDQATGQSPNTPAGGQ